MAFRRSVYALVLTAAALAVTSLHAQPADAKAPVVFDVASVKPSPDPMVPGLIVHMPGERGYRGTNMPLMTYIRVAYQLREEQITAPDWISHENFDVEAKAEKPSTADELHLMLQHLLEERFHMKIRRESREQAGYALVVDKGSSKMKDHDPEDKTSMPITGFGKHTATNVTMQYFAFYLSGEIGKTVVDKTGLSGHYDFEATWYPDNVNMATPMPGPPPGGGDVPMEMRAVMPTGPSVFNALKEQLGLRLDQTKVPAEHLVIEHIEKLTEN